MDAGTLFLLAYIAAFGDPRAVLASRVSHAIESLAPCPVYDTSCVAHHRRAVMAITRVAYEDDHPDEAAALLIGAGTHESRFATVYQAENGPARTWYQLEGTREQREAWLADDLEATRVALARARQCRQNFVSYAGGGGCITRSPRANKAAAELRTCALLARRALDGGTVRPWASPRSNGSSSGSAKSRKGSRISAPHRSGQHVSRKPAER